VPLLREGVHLLIRCLNGNCYLVLVRRLGSETVDETVTECIARGTVELNRAGWTVLQMG